MTMRAAMITRPHAAEVITISKPIPGHDEVLVRIRFVGLCGTDLEIFHGTSTYVADGRVTYPHSFGHEWVGTVVAVGPEARSVAMGDVVTGSTMIHCQTCHACAAGRRNNCSDLREVGLYGWPGAATEFLALPARAVVSLGRLDSGPRPAHVLIEPLVTVLEAVEKSNLGSGDKVLVVGAGTIGSLASKVLARYPVEVDIVEPASVAHLAGSASRRFRCFQEIETQYDVVFECSGGTDAFSDSLRVVRIGGHIMLVGVAGSDEKINVGKLALDGIRITGVRHGVDHYRRAVKMFDSIGFTADDLVDCVVPLQGVAGAFERLEHPRPRPKVVIDLE